MRRDPKSIGERSEARIIFALLGYGRVVLIPFGDSQRYDLVVEEAGVFYRVQCKTGNIKNGSINFVTSSSQVHRKKGRKDYKGQIDFFAIYCPSNDKVYLLPVDEAPLTSGRLRIEAPKMHKTNLCDLLLIGSFPKNC